MKHWEGQKRATIENVKPQIDGGDYPIKRTVGEAVRVQADIFTDGHDKVGATLQYRKLPKPSAKNQKPPKWKEQPMEFLGNDRWAAVFIPDKEGEYEYTIKAFINYYGTWAAGLEKKAEAGQDLKTELEIGANLLEEAAGRAKAADKKKLEKWAQNFRKGKNEKMAAEQAQLPEVQEVMRRTQDEEFSKTFYKTFRVEVDRKKAAFSAWYELFPRSASDVAGRHGTFKGVEKRLSRIAEMGFDVLYLPPIHPIGESHRKGRNNATTAEAGDVGSPWAIGGKEGGHKAIHPELGDMKDFKKLVKSAKDHGIEIALDFAIQCSPDHPYVKEHPEWFKWRPDGTVQYAENPPKKYQDVLPIDFETEDWENLWEELKSIVDFWIAKGVKIFRVDNPHTKPFRFWEWLIEEVHRKNPEVIFLAEAFTRPRIMEKLAKIGFTQSYTYFTWRNTAEEIQEYMRELTQTELREYFRPNFWPNTPDILPISLERQPESAFLARLIMAATLSSNYGIYGPVFEFGLNEPYPNKEEYIDNEKYELKHWDWQRRTRTSETITAVNKIRRENAALQSTWHIEFCECANPQLLCFAKTDWEKQNRIIVIINLDPHHTQSGWVQLPLKFLEMREGETFAVHDLLNGSRYNWGTGWNYVELHPQVMPAHIFRVEGSVAP